MQPLTRERWRQLTPILEEAFELDAEARATYLDKACAGDADLRADVDALINAEHSAGSFLEEAAGAYLTLPHKAPDLWPSIHASLAGSDVPPATLIGPYRVLGELATGGMGTVYVAERADGQYEQRVALKLIRRELDSDHARRRFLVERQILARLNHANIARLMDGGILNDGRPWFAMELIDGVPLTRYCDEHRLDIEHRLGLFLAVCDAVRYAHQNLIVHRDLKPLNMLVTADAHVKLLDFGIAKLLESDAVGGERSAETRTEVRAMTPEYAAPEQVRGDPVSTTTDVYALGAVLYELLTGHRAHQFERRTPAEYERVVCDTEPERPSAVVTRVSRADASPGDEPAPNDLSDLRGVDLRTLRRKLIGDLDTIILRALEKEPARRYPSVEAMADDVRSYLAALPIRARPGSATYRFRKFIRRHRAGALASAAVMLAIVGGVGATIWQARAKTREAAKAQEVKNFVVGLFQVADPAESRGREITARELLLRGVQRVDSALGSQPDVQQELLSVLGNIHRQLGLFAEADTLFARSVEVARRVYGPRHSEVAARLTDRGTSLMDLGEIAPAESVLSQALTIRLNARGSKPSDVANTMRELANALSAAGKYARAESLYRAVLSIDRGHLASDDLAIATDLENLGVLLSEGTSRLREIDSVYREALAIRRNKLDAGHPLVLNLVGNLASNVESMGRFAEAESLYHVVLDGRRRLYPDGQHPDIAYTLHEIANVLELTGRWAEAESVNVEALTLRRRVLGPDHPMTMATLNNLAIVRYRMGRLDSAEAAFREALRLWNAKLGPKHVYTLRAMSSLGAVLSEEGKFSEADSLLGSVVRTYRATGDSSADVAVVMRNLGVLQYRMHRLQEAEVTLRWALGVYRRELPNDHPRVAEALTALGQVLTEQARAADAEPLLREAVAIRTSKFSADDRRTAESRAALGVALAARGQKAAAESLLVMSCRALRADPWSARQTRECEVRLGRVRR